ncbi:hypothetical protein V5F89_10900 [Pelagerythrobacter marensis]|uniref:Lipoprotein n=1 Tax=Pelagerythrobacter marensis TaxID=543877 RepID=A0ABZ2D171_9SPHN
MDSKSISHRVAIAAIGLPATLSSCSSEIDYMAKYCTGYDTVLYINDDMKTFVSSGALDASEMTEGNFEGGEIIRKDSGGHYEYDGEFMFSFPKSNFITEAISDSSLKIRNGSYIVEGHSSEGNHINFYIDQDGSLSRFVEILSTQGGDEVAVMWTLCGGNFTVN